MIKKYGALLLAGALLVTMSACSGRGGDSIRGNVTPAQTTAPEATVPETTERQKVKQVQHFFGEKPQQEFSN